MAHNQEGHFFLFSCLLLTIWMPRTGYHKLYSCTFLSGTVKCRVIYTLYGLYALEDPLNKYTLSIMQPKSIFVGSCSRHVLKWSTRPGLKMGTEFWIRPEIGSGKSHSLVKLWRGKKHTACRAKLNWFLGVVQLYWNGMWCFVELKYNVCSQL